jgi:hypothetical protein
MEKGSDSLTTNNNPPGTTGVIRTHGGAGFRCTFCEKDIEPIMLEVDDVEIPACEDCFLDEVVEAKQEMGTVLSDAVAIAVGDQEEEETAYLTPEERMQWENYCC